MEIKVTIFFGLTISEPLTADPSNVGGQKLQMSQVIKDKSHSDWPKIR